MKKLFSWAKRQFLGFLFWAIMAVIPFFFVSTFLIFVGGVWALDTVRGWLLNISGKLRREDRHCFLNLNGEE